jgi:RND family efflux transporter MFP subunit
VAEVEGLELIDLQRDLRDALREDQVAARNLKQLEEAGPGAVAAKEVEEARSAWRQARAGLDVARQKLLAVGVPAEDVARLERDPEARPLRTLPVRSPLGGVATHVDVGIGQVVEPADHLVEVADLSRLWVKVRVLEKDLGRVAVGQRLTVRWPGTGGAWTGTVRVKERYLDPQTHWGAAWAELANPDGRLLPGMVGRAEVRIPAGRSALRLPASALVSVGAERFVFVENVQGREFKRQNVVVERQRGDTVWVARDRGLLPGYQVLTSGSHELMEPFAPTVLTLSEEARRNVGLTVAKAGHHRVAEVVSLRGVVDLPPGRRAVVSARLAGRHRIAVDRDAAVRVGDVVAEVAGVELQDLQLELRRGQLQVALLEQALARLRPLAGSPAVPRRTVRETEAALTAARQRRDGLRRKLLAVGLDEDTVRAVQAGGKPVESLPVRAPVAGVVVRFQGVLGQAVKPGEPLFEIHDLTGASFKLHAPASLRDRLREGQRGRVRLVAGAGQPIPVGVVRLGQELAPASRTFEVWAEPRAAPPGLLLPGTLVRADLVVSESEPTLAVPVDAVLREGSQAHLFVLRDGTWERRAVTLGRTDDQWVEVVRGLEGKETVATHGVAGLQTAYAALR